MTRYPNILLLLALFCSAQSLTWAADIESGDGPLAGLKRTPEQWIEIKKRTAQAAQRWHSDSEILRQSISALRATLEETESQIALGAQAAEEAEMAYAAASAALESRLRSEKSLEAVLVRLETAVFDLVRYVPPPLLESIGGHLRRMGEGDTPAARLQALLAVVTAMESFNKGVTSAREMRRLENGSVHDVKTLYWGLAQGFAITLDGRRAWVLAPAPDGWVWNEASERAAEVEKLFAVHDKEMPPQWVDVPVRLRLEERRGVQ